MSRLNTGTELVLYVALSHSKTMLKLTKPLVKSVFWKIEAICDIITPHRPSLVKPHCNASPETKHCRIVKNLVNKLNIHTVLGLHVESSHASTVSEVKNPLWIEATEKNKKLVLNYNWIISSQKERTWFFVSEVISFNLKATQSLQENHWFVVPCFINAQ